MIESQTQSRAAEESGNWVRLRLGRAIVDIVSLQATDEADLLLDAIADVVTRTSTGKAHHVLISLVEDLHW